MSYYCMFTVLLWSSLRHLLLPTVNNRLEGTIWLLGFDFVFLNMRKVSSYCDEL